MEAESFADRLFGLRRLQPGAALLIRTSSVHGWGMKQPFRAIGLEANLVVLAHITVKPGKLVWFPGCTAVVELPLHIPPPPIGTQLEITGV